MEYLAIWAEIEQDKNHLRELKLTEEEIEGYMIFFAENYFKEKEDDYLRLSMSRMQAYSRGVAQKERLS